MMSLAIWLPGPGPMFLQRDLPPEGICLYRVSPIGVCLQGSASKGVCLWSVGQTF